MDTDTQTIRHLQQENIRLRSENSSLKSYVERLQRALRALVALQHNLERINSDTDVFQLVHQILQNALDAVDSDNGSLMLLDDETGDLVFVEVVGNARDKLLNFRLPKGQGIAHWVVTNRQSRLVEDARREPIFSPQVDKLTSMNTISLICVPLLDGSRTLGTIEVVNTLSGRPFNESDKEIMELVGQLSALAIVTAEKAQNT
jgi:GAF domain-containing protein